MSGRDVILAILVGALVAVVAIANIGPDPADEALRIQAEQLRDSIRVAELRADSADARRTALQAEVDASAQAADDARREAEQASRVAAQTAAAAEARLRTVLDSLGVSAAPVDSLVASWQVRVEVRDVRIAALERQVGALTLALAAADSATEAQRARAEAVEAERNLYAIRLGVAEKRAARAELEQKVVMGLAAVGAACGAFDQKECSLAANGLSFAIAVR